MGSTYSAVRGALGEAYEDAESLLDERPEFEPALDLVEAAGQWTTAIGRDLRAAAPGVIQGALTGFLAGGPAGAAVGAVAGGVQSRMAPTASAPSPLGVANMPMTVANPAAAQLLGALLRREAMQALGALLLGPDGASSVPVAGTPVPVAAFAKLIAALASQAAAQHHGTVPAMARAEGLLDLLGEAEASDCCDSDARFDARFDSSAFDEAMTARDLEDLDRLQ